jgi:hypothetical protein
VKIPNLDVDACVKREAIDIGEEGIEEVVAKFLAMLRVKSPTTIQVTECGRQNPQLHAVTVGACVWRRPSPLASRR